MFSKDLYCRHVKTRAWINCNIQQKTRLLRIYSICEWQIESGQNDGITAFEGTKNILGKQKMLLTSNFSFSHNIFRRLLLPGSLENRRLMVWSTARPIFFQRIDDSQWLQQDSFLSHHYLLFRRQLCGKATSAVLYKTLFLSRWLVFHIARIKIIQIMVSGAREMTSDNYQSLDRKFPKMGIKPVTRYQVL